MAGKLFPFSSEPGIKRDGTRFASRYYTDGQWVRFQRNLPRKMGGYKKMFDYFDHIPRGMFVAPTSSNFNIYIGDQGSLVRFPVKEDGSLNGVPVPITPIQGFSPNVNNTWQFDIMFSTVDNTNVLIASCPPNLGSISSTVNTPVFYGDVNSDVPLQPIPNLNVSGGVSVFHPYLFTFGNDGEVNWSEVNDPTTILGTARVASQKVVAGLPTRGGNSSPAGLLWTLDSVIRVTFVGANPGEFRFDTITSQSSILSSNSIVEYDGVYFWAGIDRFLMYNGVVQELPNQLNLNFFYSNPLTKLNYNQRQKVWATKVPQYGEIWWFYPSVDSSDGECDRTVIFNKRENTWYDTKISRSCGYYEQVFADPIWADNTKNTDNKYNIWQHEAGVDKVEGTTKSPILSTITSGDIAYCALGPNGEWSGEDRWVDLYRFEPDFIQRGNITLDVIGRQYAHERPDKVSLPGLYIFNENTNKIDIREQRREMRIKLTSNELNGFFEMGQPLLYFRVGDARA